MAIPGKSRDMTVTESSPLPRKLEWQLTEVRDVIVETPRVKSLLLKADNWPGHLPGQRVDIRLTADDGYQAQRSYSLASPPEEELLELTVERVTDGEVSPYLLDELRVGDRLELRGPIGGYFVWEARLGGPLQLVAGGSGIVPLMAMLLHRAASGSHVPARLLYSSRTYEDIIYREALDRLAGADTDFRIAYTLTRAQPPGWTGYGRRIDGELLGEVTWPAEEQARAYICGPTPFVEVAASTLLGLGYPAERIYTERFGPTGGA